MSTQSTPPATALSTLATIDAVLGARMREGLDKLAAIHHRNTGGYCDAGREGVACTGATCDIVGADTHLLAGPKHTVEDWIRAHRHTRLHTVEVGVAGPNRAWRDRTAAIDEEHSFTLTSENGPRKRYGLLGMEVLASDDNALLVHDGYEMALFVAEGAGHRYAQSDQEHAEKARARRHPHTHPA